MSEVTKQVMGIDVTLDPAVLEDWDVMCSLTALIPDDSGEMTTEQLKDSVEALKSLAETLYGGRFETIKKRLRKAHGGKLSITTVSEFIGETFEAFQKN